MVVVKKCLELVGFLIVVNFVLIIFVIVNVEIGSFMDWGIIFFGIFILFVGWMECELLFVWEIGVEGIFWKYWILSVRVLNCGLII